MKKFAFITFIFLSFAHAQYKAKLSLKDEVVFSDHLSSMGARSGEVIQWNGAQWVPYELNGPIFMGVWDASSNSPDLLSAGALGEYYIVSNAGSFDLGSGMTSWSVGDRVIWNNAQARWEQIAAISSIKSFNLRSSIVTSVGGDYSLGDIDRATSALGDLGDIDTSSLSVGDVLTWNGSSWVAQSDQVGSSVNSSDITNSSLTDADFASGIAMAKITGLSGVLSNKLNLIGGTMSGDLTMGAHPITVSGNVDGVDLQALESQLNTINTSLASKENTLIAGTPSQYFRGDGSWQVLDRNAVGLGNVDNVQQIPLSYLDNGVLSNSATSIPSSNAAMTYIDSLEGVNPDGSQSITGALRLEAGLRFYDSDQSNYVELQAPASMTSDNSFVLPGTAGTNGQVLLTDGLGVTSWSTLGPGPDITEVTAGSNLSGGAATGSATVNLTNFGSGPGQILQLNSLGRLPAVNGSLLLQLQATILGQSLTGHTLGTNSALSVGDNIASAFSKLEGQIANKEAQITTGTSAQFLDGTGSLQTLSATSVNLGNLTNDAQLPLSLVDDGPLSTSTLTVPTSGAAKAYIDNQIGSSASITAINTTTSSGITGGALTGDISLQINAGGGANQIVALAGNNRLPASKGSFLTNLPILSQTLDSLPAGSDSTILATDTLLSAFAKLQAQASANDTELSSALTNTSLATSTTLGTSDTLVPTQNAVKEYIDANIASFNVETHSTDYTIDATTDNNKLFLVSGETIITLPSASTAGSGFSISIKKTDATNKVTVETAGVETIDDRLTNVLYSQYASSQYISDGTNWVVAYSLGNIQSPISCPPGFVEVKGNSDFSTSDFCVMQYEAKVNGLNIVSTASNSPKTANLSVAFSDCAGITHAGFSGTFALISNPEWMTIVRDAEGIAANWTSGIKEVGCLHQGNVGTSSACSNSAGYNGANPEIGTGRDTRARYILSNGSEVWDISGNMAEWVDWRSNDGTFTLAPTDASFAPREIDVLSGSFSALDISPGYTYTTPSNFGLGLWVGGTGGAALRGGAYDIGANSGAFSLAVNYGSTVSFANTGFRCVYRP